VLNRLLTARAAREPVALITHLESGEQALRTAGDTLGPEALLADVSAELDEMLRSDVSGLVATSRGEIFVHVFSMAPRLLIVGGVHIAQALARIASLAGYDVTIVDPRGAFATVERFPGVEIANDWPDEALERLGLDCRTAVVTLSHDPKLDDPALAVALRSEAFYVGSLGSRRSHAARLRRLEAAGLAEAETSRIHGPVGLDIGARSPAEIAVAIMAEITQALRQGRPDGGGR
jgi:xanthine dehydrogenase accessory factor